MFDDPWPEEPDEPLGDPETQFSLQIPTNDDVPSDLRRTFWGLVAVFNIALFTLALGPLLIVFRSRLIVGSGITALGILSFLYGVHRYRSYREEWVP